MNLEFMPWEFSSPSSTSSEVATADSNDAANNFWTRAHNLNRYDRNVLNTGPLRAHRQKLCGFCQACFNHVPTNGATKRTDHQNGVQTRSRSAKYCSICAFYSKLILNRCRDGVLRNKHEFTVYTRNTENLQSSTPPIMDVGFHVKSQVMSVMAFCADLSKHPSTK
jgi:ribosomal protein S26